MHHPSDNLIDKLDYKRLLDLYEDDTEMLISHIEIFMNEVMPHFLELEQGIRSQNWQDVTNLTHQLRPWLGMVGLTDLENDLWQIEKVAKKSPEPDTMLRLGSAFDAKLKQMTLVLTDELQRIR